MVIDPHPETHLYLSAHPEVLLLFGTSPLFKEEGRLRKLSKAVSELITYHKHKLPSSRFSAIASLHAAQSADWLSCICGF